MKKTILLLLLCSSLTQVMAQNVVVPNDAQCVYFDICYKIIDEGSPATPSPRTPIQPPTVYLCDHTLYICGDYGDFSLQVLTDDETAVYSTYVPSGTTEVQLPATLSDDYQAKVTGTGACCQALSPDCKVKISVPTTRPVIYVPFTAICG
jgi:hypothetical protein